MADGVHGLHPQHLIFSFHGFDHPLSFHHLADNQIRPDDCLFVQIGKNSVKLTLSCWNFLLTLLLFMIILPTFGKVHFITPDCIRNTGVYRCFLLTYSQPVFPRPEVSVPPILWFVLHKSHFQHFGSSPAFNLGHKKTPVWQFLWIAKKTLYKKYIKFVQNRSTRNNPSKVNFLLLRYPIAASENIRSETNFSDFGT